MIATATVIQPDFAGTVTLELANLGNIPIVMYVGVRIAQLRFFALGRDPFDDEQAEEPSADASERDETPAVGDAPKVQEPFGA